GTSATDGVGRNANEFVTRIEHRIPADGAMQGNLPPQIKGRAVRAGAGELRTSATPDICDFANGPRESRPHGFDIEQRGSHFPALRTVPETADVLRDILEMSHDEQMPRHTTPLPPARTADGEAFGQIVMFRKTPHEHGIIPHRGSQKRRLIPLPIASDMT